MFYHILLFFASTLSIAILQSAFLPAVFSPEWLPQILVVGTVLFSAGLSIDKTWKFILVTGIFFDIISYLPWGSTALTLLIIGYISSVIIRRLFFLQAPWGLILMFVTSVIGAILYLFFASFFVKLGMTHSLAGAFSPVSWSIIWRLMITSGVLTGFLYWPTLVVVHWINKNIFDKNRLEYVR